MRTQPKRRRARVLLILALSLFMVGLGAVYGCQRRILFPGGGPVPAVDLAERVPGAIALDVAHSDGRSEGVLLLGVGVDAAHPGPAVVLAHGNGETIDQQLSAARRYQAAGVSVALLEYRGYGRSDGSPSQTGLVADAVTFVDQLRARPEVDGARLLYHGRSPEAGWWRPSPPSGPLGR